MEKNKLPPKTTKLLDEFASGLKDIYQEGLISVALYGSCASGEFASGTSNINLLIVLNNTGLKNLSRCSAFLKKKSFREFHCLFFTPDSIAVSTDVFPIEFLDMKENYSIIYGKDLLSALSIDLKNLRFQCEQELKAKLIGIQSFYMLNRDKSALQKALLKYFTSFLHISRNLIRLKGKTPAYLKEEIIDGIKNEFKIDTENLKKILELKNKKLMLNYRDTEALLFDFVGTLETITRIVDEI
jgi:hypothetical protein